MATARSIGWVFAPLLSGLVASAYDIRTVFPVGGVLFLALAVLIGTVAPRRARVAGR